MTHGTIEETYEYLNKNIVKEVVTATEIEELADGNQLEVLLEKRSEERVQALLDDINEWMGFDDLSKQVKEG